MTDKSKLSVDKFSWIQMYNNSEGKTSGMLFTCTMASNTAIMSFSCSWIILLSSAIYAAWNKEPLIVILPIEIQNLLQNMMMQSAGLFTVAQAGLGVRRFTTDKHVTTEDEIKKE